MGKYVLLIVLGAAGVWALAQQQTEMQTAEKRAERGEEVLARQAARTGFNAILAKTRTVAQEKCPDEVVSSVGSISGTHETDGYDHGTYEGWLEDASSVDFGYRAHAKGEFNGATVTFDRLVQRGEGRAGLVYARGNGSGGGNKKLKQTTSDGSEEFGSAPQIKGMGALATDLDGDGKDEVPYIRKANQKIEMIDEDASNQGDTQELVGSNAQEGVPADQKTRLSTGTWDGSQESVFYADEDNEAIYRTWWDGGGGNDNIEEIRSPGNGAQAVLGIDDIDGDNEAELVFADASQHIRYIEEPGGTIEKLENGGIGSSEGIGAGSLVDLDGDGTVSAIFVNGSNNLRVVDANGTDRTIHLDDGSDDGAAKSPPTAIDLDGDGELEIAYIREEDEENPQIEYVETDGSNIRPLCGISVHKSSGLVSTDEGGF